MSEQDHRWDRHGAADRSAGESGGSIDRLEQALARIAAAAGRKQDALRVAELTARAAQHETDLLMQAEEQRRAEAEANRFQETEEQDRLRDATLRDVAGRIDSLISVLRAELDHQPAGD
ncbi:hypothetical protein NFI95_11370 [Acetobacteraceae bacterium KSS8]|uniref:DUF4164 family protein n=1 Tax=Endosaccharibacter trunci TaxID=2812733 RepID=A0ABT1W9X4_9PROT|nr:hypothetical protein [Acetobacteraceae bacterium KSS8]